MKQKKLLLSDYGIISSDNVLMYRLDSFVYYAGLIDIIVFGILTVATLTTTRSLVVSSIFLAFTLLGVLLILGYRNAAYYYSSGVILVRNTFGKVTLYNCSDVVKVCYGLNNTTVFHFIDGKKLKFDITESDFVSGVMKAERLQYEYTGDNVIKVRVSRFSTIIGYTTIAFLIVACLVCRMPGWLCVTLILTPMLLIEVTTSVTYTRDTNVLTKSVLFIKRSYDLTEYIVSLYVDSNSCTGYIHVCKGYKIVCKIKLSPNMRNTWELCEALGINIESKSM